MDRRQPLPRLWMMTDERQGDGLFDALDRLPEGSGLVFRHYSLPAPERRNLFLDVQAAARKRNVLLMLAGEPQLADAWGADGSHGLYEDHGLNQLLHSAPVHSLDELAAAQQAGADFVFLSPVFPTRTHPGAATLGPAGFASIATEARVPVIALGGMDEAKAQSLAGMNMYGWAAIDAWA